MADHECLHEKDFGILFTKVDFMIKSFESQTIAMEALKIAVDAAIKYQISMKAIRETTEKERMPHLYQVAIIISIIIAIATIATAYIIEFH